MSLHFHVLGSHLRVTTRGLTWSVFFGGNIPFSIWVSEWKSLSRVQLFVTPRSMQSMEFSRQENWSGLPFPYPGDLSNPGIKPKSPTLQVDSLPAEPQGKPKNTAVGSLPLLQQIFPTQELNLGLLHCRQILYQLTYQGSPLFHIPLLKFTNCCFLFFLIFIHLKVPNQLLILCPYLFFSHLIKPLPSCKQIYQQQKTVPGISLVVQWLRLCVPNAGVLGSIPGQRTRSHMLKLKIPNAKMKTEYLCVAAKTQHSQLRKTMTSPWISLTLPTADLILLLLWQLLHILAIRLSST